jgi:hypothetical protein
MVPRTARRTRLLHVTIRGTSEHVVNVLLASRIATHHKVMHAHRQVTVKEIIVRQMIVSRDNEDQQIGDKQTGRHQNELRYQNEVRQQNGRKASSQKQMRPAIDRLANDPADQQSLSDHDQQLRMISGRVLRDPFLPL